MQDSDERVASNVTGRIIVGPLFGLAEQLHVKLAEPRLLEAELLRIQQIISRMRAIAVQRHQCGASSKLKARLQSLTRQMQLG